MKQGNKIIICFRDIHNTVPDFELPVVTMSTATSPQMFPSGYLNYDGFSVVPDKTYTKFNNNVVSFIAFKLNNKIFKTFNTIHFNDNDDVNYTVGNDFMLTDPYMYPVGSIVECAETIDIKGITKTENYERMIGSTGSPLSNSLAQFLGKIYTTQIVDMSTMERFIGVVVNMVVYGRCYQWSLLAMKTILTTQSYPSLIIVLFVYYLSTSLIIS